MLIFNREHAKQIMKQSFRRFNPAPVKKSFFVPCAYCVGYQAKMATNPTCIFWDTKFMLQIYLGRC